MSRTLGDGAVRGYGQTKENTRWRDYAWAYPEQRTSPPQTDDVISDRTGGNNLRFERQRPISDKREVYTVTGQC